MRELTIDWPALHSAFQMNMPEVRCFLSLDDGRVLKVPPGDPRLNEVRGEPKRYAPVEAVPSRIQYQWLDEFIHSVTDTDARSRMEAAINGKGAFRRFKDILLTLPEERRRWFEYRDIKMRERIVEWVAEQGVRSTNEAPWAAEDKATLSAKPDDTVAAESTPVAEASSPAKSISSSYDIEALRDFLIAWSEKQSTDALSPVVLENLAQKIGETFEVRAR